jgi:pimeloyl-ACP methyl ester carboxylesterase
MNTGPISRSFISQRLRLHYVDWGNEAAPPLILVHGARDHCRNWDWVAERLAPHYHVIAPDLRGHGDSDWCDGGYSRDNFIYDLHQLIDQQVVAPVRIVAHSLGANIALRYAGVFPDKVCHIAAIEGLGRPPKHQAAHDAIGMHELMTIWFTQLREVAARQPRRYPTLHECFLRMREENKYLSEAQAWHLTRHGVRQNEDSTFSWKFDNYIRAWPPFDMPLAHEIALWGRITCPTLLIYGRESWASNPAEDGRLGYFKNARAVSVEGAGHWVHHDRLDMVMAELIPFLA